MGAFLLYINKPEFYQNSDFLLNFGSKFRYEVVYFCSTNSRKKFSQIDYVYQEILFLI